MPARPIVDSAMRAQVQSLPWPADRAILLVHGVGNAKPGDYGELLASLRAALGPAAGQYVVYQLFYDTINDWFAEKTQLASQLSDVLRFLEGKVDATDLAKAMVEVVGDVLWPVMSGSARSAIRELYLAQIKQMVLDGLETLPGPRDMKISIVCHSLGCYHTYEVLHAAARYETHRLQPATHGVRFENVVFMASPVQLIRTVGRGMGSFVSKRWSATLDDEGLSRPGQESFGSKVQSVKNWVSITGRLDPVGGFFSRTKAEWAYMNVAGQKSIVDAQDHLDFGSDADLAAALRSALRERRPPEITVNNPHSWVAYVDRHRGELAQWLGA